MSFENTRPVFVRCVILFVEILYGSKYIDRSDGC
jgi:hypothetical protein